MRLRLDCKQRKMATMIEKDIILGSENIFHILYIIYTHKHISGVFSNLVSVTTEVTLQVIQCVQSCSKVTNGQVNHGTSTVFCTPSAEKKMTKLYL